jgi:hypothetical protein
MRSIFLLLFAPLALACGSSGTADDGGAPDGTLDAPADGPAKDSGSADASMNDAGDAGAADSGALDSGPDAQPACASANDCKKFSSYCMGSVLQACKCYGINKLSPNPVCDGSMVTCLIDPCQNKNVGCDAGSCFAY